VGRRTASVTPAVIKLVVLLPGLICNKRAHDANDCYLVCNDYEPICNDCEPGPESQLRSMCAHPSDDCDYAAIWDKTGNRKCPR
jgi:hypothetical protein